MIAGGTERRAKAPRTIASSAWRRTTEARTGAIAQLLLAPVLGLDEDEDDAETVTVDEDGRGAGGRSSSA